MTLAERAAGPTIARRQMAPPHSAEAEESVIGAVLRSPPTADDVFDRLAAEGLLRSRPPHDLHGDAASLRGEPAHRHGDRGRPVCTGGGELDKAGGTGFVVGFWDAVPSAANVDYYARVVEEHSLRRRMLRASNKIAELAMDLDVEVDVVLDQAEQAMLAVAEKRVGEGLEVLGGLLSKVLERLEQVESEGLDVTGLPTGLVDLDHKLGGLQPATLVVVAGRPGMGKSALAMNIASHVAIDHGPGGVLQHGDVPDGDRLPLAGIPGEGGLDEAAVRSRGRRFGSYMGGPRRGDRPPVQGTSARRRRIADGHRYQGQVPPPQAQGRAETGSRGLHAVDARPQP